MKKTTLLFSMLVPFCMISQNITSITPNTAMQGQTIPLIISGNNMSFSGWSCWSNTGNLSDFRFSQWSGMNMLYGAPTSATATQLNGNLSVPAFQPIGIYNLEVFDCSTSWWIQLPNSFQINAAATASWNCMNGACVDPGTGSGIYTSLAACQANCVNPSWDCDPSNGSCFDPGTGTGQYSTFMLCQLLCVQTATLFENIKKLTIFPNPSQDVFSIQFKNLIVQDIKINIINNIGELVFSENLIGHIGAYNKKIDLKENAKGIYFLEIETDDGFINKKLILQ